MTQSWTLIRQLQKLVRPAFLLTALRRLAFLVGIVLLFALGMRLVGPYVISSNVVRSTIERTISEWTGYRTVIRGETDLSYWPSSRISMDDVAIYGDNDPEKPPLMKIRRLVAFFDLFSMLRGIPDFNDFQVTAPEINLERRKDGSFNWESKGRMARAIAYFADENATADAFPDDLDLHVGNIRIENGIVNVISLRGMTFSLSNVTATLTWPQITKPASLTMNAALNLTAFNLKVKAAAPLPLLAGRNEDLTLSFESNPANIEFAGITNILNNGFMSGHVKMSAPSLSDLFLFTGFTSERTGSLKDFSLDADVSTEDTVLRLSKLSFGVSGTKATGVMDIGIDPASIPQVNGTLAFDRFSVDKAVDAFGPKITGEMDTSFLQKLRMDLRLSADEATYSGLSLSNLAAGIRIADGRASLDLGESQFLGGTLMGRFSIRDDRMAGTGGGQIDLHAESIDLGALSQALGLPGPYPAATGTADLSAATDKPMNRTQIADYHGALDVSAAAGTLKNFSEADFRQLASAKKFFQLKDAENGDFPFQSFLLQATFADGIAELKDVSVTGADHMISVNGVVPYPGFSLALAGSLKATDAARSDGPDLNVFIGGTLASAVISPVSIAINRQP